jgi:hypothetical protein
MKRYDESSIKQVLGYTQTVDGLAKVTKRAWAEYFGMKRKIIRQEFLMRVYGTLLLGFVTGLILDKLT